MNDYCEQFLSNSIRGFGGLPFLLGICALILGLGAPAHGQNCVDEDGEVLCTGIGTDPNSGAIDIYLGTDDDTVQVAGDVEVSGTLSVGGESITESIATNAEAIGTNAEAIGTNEEAIAANTQAIADGDAANGERIDSNWDAIAANQDDIAANGERIDSNWDAIAANQDDIAANGDAIAANWDAIATNIDGIAVNMGAIDMNAQGIAANSGAIDMNAQGIAANSGAIGANAANIAANSGAIANNASNIAANTAEIAMVDTRVKRVAAMAAALSAVPNVVPGGDSKVYFGMGIGTHDGKSGIAAGVSGRFGANENIFVNAGAAVSGDETTFRAGVGWLF